MLETSRAQKKLMIALDIPDAEAAYAFCQALDLPHAVFKIGLELLFAGGTELARKLAREGYSVFVDAKFLDIGNTVERATAQIADLGAEYLTVHAHDSATVEAAVRGRGGSALKLLGVTVLTSLSQAGVKEQGIALPLEELAVRRATFAQEAGFHGVITSPRELAAMKARFGDTLALVTPGIRPASETGIAGDDQARTATPSDAIRGGADALVVGRPILRAQDPKAAAIGIVAEIARAMADKTAQ